MDFKVSSNEPFQVTREADQKSVDVLNLKTSDLTNDSGYATVSQAEDVVLGKLVTTGGILASEKFYKFLGTYSTKVGERIETPDFSSTEETPNVNKIYVDISTNTSYKYDGSRNVLRRFEQLDSTSLSNYYTKTQVDEALALKQDIDDVYVDQAYIDENGIASFETDNKRYNIVESITLSEVNDDGQYEFGENCILHFFNQGMINAASGETISLCFAVTQIEAPMKQIFDLNVNFNGLLRNSEVYPEWWGAKGDGSTDDSTAINRCIYCAGHTPVVLTAEHYLVASTVGFDEPTFNQAINTATGQGWTGSFAGQFIVKHNIIGDANLAGPVVRFAISYGYCKIDGTILVRNTSDDAVAFTTFPSSGGPGITNSEIDIFRIDRASSTTGWPLNSLASSNTGVGLGVGAAFAAGETKVRIYNIRGFKQGCWLARFRNCNLYVGTNESVYCFYAAAPKATWYSTSSNWYVCRNEIKLGQQISGIPSFISSVTDSSIVREFGGIEMALNTYTVGDTNNATASYRHPHKHSLYYTYGNAGHTGNVYNFNITYAIETSREFVKFEFSSNPGSTNKGPNSDTINFGVGCFLQDINIPYGWNVKLHNVILSNTAKTKGTYRWFGNSGEMLIDTITVTRASTPIFDSTSPTIRLLDINPQFKGSAVSVSTTPSTCDNNKFYVVDNPTTTNGTKKYPVYYNYFGNGATLIGYTLDNYKELTPYEGRPKVISNSATYNSTMEENKLYIFGSSTTQVTSFTLTGFTTPVNANVANSYHGIITCGNNMTFTIPNTVTVSEGRSLPSFSAGGIFEFDILEIGSNQYLMHFSYTEP